MAERICGSCGARLEEDLVASTGAAECPFCGGSVSDAFPDETHLLEGPRPTTVRAAAAADPTLPPGSGIQLIAADGSRELLFIPGSGKQARSIGCFALLWTGVTAAVTAGLAVGAAHDPAIWPAFLFLSVFWLVGLGMIFWWITLHFTRTHLLLERDRLVLQKILFHRKSIEQTALGPEARADLVEAYQQNHVPVYRVEVSGRDRAVKFGTALSQAEKEWLVRRINRFLGVADVSPSAAAGWETGLGPAAILFEPPPPDLKPSELPAESLVRVEEADPDHLRFHLTAVPRGPVRTVAVWFASSCALFWMAVSCSVVVVALINLRNPGDWIPAAMAAVMALGGLLPAGIAWGLARGRVTVDVSREALSCRWHVGRWGVCRQLPTASITHVGVTRSTPAAQLAAEAGRKRSTRDVPVCLVQGAGMRLPLTTFHDRRTVREVAGLVRGQLHRLGFLLEDE